MILLAEFESIQYRLLAISIEEFSLSEVPQIDEKRIVIAVDLDWDLVVQDRKIIAIFRVSCSNGGKVWLSSQINCQFEYEIDQGEGELLILENIREFPNAFLEQLGSIAVGAARGILHERTADVRTVLLPLLDIKMMVEDEPHDMIY